MSAASEADKRVAQLDAYVEERDAAKLKAALEWAAWIENLYEGDPTAVAVNKTTVLYIHTLSAAARDREQAVEAERRRCAKVLTDEAAKLDDTCNSFDADSAQLLRGMAAALLEGEI